MSVKLHATMGHVWSRGSCLLLFPGNLYFAHVMSPDEGDYVCHRENRVYRASVSGGDTRIFPQPSGKDGLQKSWHGLQFLVDCRN